MVQYFCVAEFCVGFENNYRSSNFYPLVVRYSYDRNFADFRELEDDAFHFGWVNVLAAGDVHVFPAIDDVIETILVSACGITSF